MKIAIFERNLLWSARLAQSLRSLGHEPFIVTNSNQSGDWDAAILNLSDPDVAALANRLAEQGIPTIAHAGHKEKELLVLGKDSGCTIVASNSELTFKIGDLVERAVARGTNGPNEQS